MNTQTAETTTIDAAEEMGQVADLIAAGATREARRRTARLADTATVSTRALLGEILAALETHPAVTIAKLRDLWKVSDEDGRALVLACVPHAERRAEAAKQASKEPSPRQSSSDDEDAPGKKSTDTQSEFRFADANCTSPLTNSLTRSNLGCSRCC